MIDVSRETRARLDRYVDLLLAENEQQNLISRGTIGDIWNRHIVDALQLTSLAPDAKSWVDVGSGPGLPGMVIAIATEKPVFLIEPRPLRTKFLQAVADDLSLPAVTVFTGKAQQAVGRFDAITARAVAKAPEIFRMAMHLSHSGTRWVLPKGRTVQMELEAVESSWQGRFRVEPSRTDPEAGIIVADQVRPRGRS